MLISRFSLMKLFKSTNLLQKLYLDLFLVILYFLSIASQIILYNFSDKWTYYKASVRYLVNIISKIFWNNYFISNKSR
jgi:hypothetical protein